MKTLMPRLIADCVFRLVQAYILMHNSLQADEKFTRLHCRNSGSNYCWQNALKVAQIIQYLQNAAIQRDNYSFSFPGFQCSCRLDVT